MSDTVKLFVEGGGDMNPLRSKCRKAYSEFLAKAGLNGCMPRIVACGSRNEAYSDYCTAIKNGEQAVLLVDSESPVLIERGDKTYDKEDNKTWKPWYHLKNRKGNDGQLADNWDKPKNALDEDCHLMVELMETWFLADIDALQQYYGKDFRLNSLPKETCIEKISKCNVMNALNKATRSTGKGPYSKGDHSFELLERIDPVKVKEKSPWANRFITMLFEKCNKKIGIRYTL